MNGQTESSRDVVLRAWKAFGSRDPEQVAAVFTSDAEWFAPPRNATAVAVGTHHMVGRERIVRFLTEEFPAIFAADVEVEFRSVIAEGSTVVVEERMRATLDSGRPYENDYCFVFELRDGLVHRIREYMDTRRGVELFGA
ncbi:nuclear transport factor 2 family protein [Actinomycetes bacterium KLBMP 9759]